MPAHQYERVTSKDRVVSALCLGGCMYGAWQLLRGFTGAVKLSGRMSCVGFGREMFYNLRGGQH